VIVRIAFFVHLSVDVTIASNTTVFYRTEFRSQLEMVMLCIQIHTRFSKREKEWNIAQHFKLVLLILFFIAALSVILYLLSLVLVRVDAINNKLLTIILYINYIYIYYSNTCIIISVAIKSDLPRLAVRIRAL
jgi:hypothetical protein